MARWEKWLVDFSHIISLGVSDITSNLHFHASNSVFLTADIIDQAQIAAYIRAMVLGASIHKQY